MSLLGLDIGITGCKAVAFDPRGAMLAEAYREYPLYQPHPGWMELDPDEVWSAVKEVIHHVAHTAADPVTALAVSTHGESVVPIDAHGQPLYRFLTAIDTRATAHAAWWGEHFGAERLFRITGMPLHPMYTVNKLMWLREHEPAIFHDAQRFLCMPDFVFHQLGVPPAMDFSLAARTMAFDINRLEWSDEILAAAQIDRSKFSPAVQSGTVLGPVAPAIARELGLAPGALAVIGGHDHPCGTVGCGAISEGLVMDATGTVECIGVSTRQLALDKALMDANLPIAAGPIKGLYVVLGWSSVGGALLRWVRDNFARAEVEEARRTGASVYDLILADAPAGPSPVLVLPHFVGSGTPWLDPVSKGAILGLDLSTTRGQIVKGILDGVTFEIKLSMDAMQAAGVPVAELRAIGGGARSSLWLQTKADIFGKPVVAMDVAEAPSLACAILAGTATGIFASVADGVSQMVRPRRTFEPDMAMHERYMERGRLFNEVYPTLAGLNHRM